jgi:hypothetical protein
MNRTKTWLLSLGLLSVLSCTALAQERYTGYEQADIPAPVPEMGDSWFAQPQLSTYGRGPQPPNGVYFNVDYMRLAIQAPEAAPIGEAGSSLSTGQFINEFDNGSRYEIGNRVDDKGWLVGGFQISQNQTIRSGGAAGLLGANGSGAAIVFEQGPAAGFNFENIHVHNQTNAWGLEIMRTWRLEPERIPYAVVCEWMFGVRYLYFRDIYDFDGFRNNSEGVWQTKSENNLIGPQIGVRFSKQYGPWFISVEPRAFAGFNFQTLNQQGRLPDSIVAANLPAPFNNSQNQEEFSPVGEFRADVAYLLTRKVRTRFGYAGYWIDNLARAPSLVNYSIPVAGLTTPVMGFNNNPSQDSYIQGIYWGIEVNH